MKARAPIGWVLVLGMASLGGSGPEVVQIRVPSEKVTNWFPTGTELRVVPIDQFQALLKAIRDRPEPPTGARLLRARHRASLESGRLRGQTELSVEPGASILILDPWSPALSDPGDDASPLRATSDGRLGLRLEPGSGSTVGFDWTLRSRTGSEGRAFALKLPEVDLASLTLDLPDDLIPEATAGPRVGPEPGAGPGRAVWRFEAARGQINLRLCDDPTRNGEVGEPGLWLEGSTRIDLGAGATPWQADWSLDVAPDASRTLSIGIDPGLEVADVSGPHVASFRLEPDGAGSVLQIQLTGDARGPAPLKIRGVCQAPMEGSWTVPSARPRKAHWTGGRTLIRLGGSRVLQSCQNRSGRRVPPRLADLLEAVDLVFESTGSPGPLADLTLRRPSVETTVEVRGRLKLGDDTPRIEVALTWSVEKGRVLTYSADLPPGWTPDAARSPGKPSVPWHAEAQSNGGTRVYFAPSQVDEAARSVTLILSASANRAGVTGPLDLPRVRASGGARVVDEVWVATTEPGLAIRPILAGGLAWIDPPDPLVDAIPAPWTVAELAGALAWRWIAEDAEARIDRAPPNRSPRAEVNLQATIRSGRVGLDWSISVESARGGLESIPIHLDPAVSSSILWKCRETSGAVIEPRPMDEARRAALGFPATGQAWDLLIHGSSRESLLILGQAEVPWSGSGRLPILSLPDRYKARGLIEVRVPTATRARFQPTGLTAVEPSSGSAESGGASDEPGSGSNRSLRVAGAFGYRSGGGRLLVETSEPSPGPVGGLIREAYLVSQVSPGAGMRHRLTLGIANDAARALTMTLPSGVALDRLRRDGQPIQPTPSGDDLIIELPAPVGGRPITTLAIEYRTEDDIRSGSIEPSRLLPRLSLPCPGFAWELITPKGWTLDQVEGGLRATDPRPTLSLTAQIFGFSWSPWSGRNSSRPVEADESALRELDQSAAAIADGETYLGDWLVKLDAGPRPIVIDRLAIRSTGWGPGSRINPRSAVGLKSSGLVASILDSMGLAAVPMAGQILITASEEVPEGRDDRLAWEEAIRAVPLENSDPTDRFQTAGRWRGEATPRSMTNGETSIPATGRHGWRAWWVVSSGWPRPGASVRLVDEPSGRVGGWFVAASVLGAGVLFRRQPGRWRVVGLIALGAVASVGLAWPWPGPASSAIFAGMLRGDLAVLAFWIGRAFRRPISLRRSLVNEVANASRRSSFLDRSPISPLVLVALGLAGASSLGGSELPIVALLPYDGPASPAVLPDRVILRVPDYERLERLARPVESPAIDRVALISARHRVDRESPGLAVLVSRYEVEVLGPGPADWSLPIGSSLELSARVDDQDSPLAIAADGRTARLSLEGPGRHRVEFRRLATLSTTFPGSERIRVPINRAAFAQIRVAKKEGVAVAVVGGSGDLSTEGSEVAGDLGPTDLIEVRWSSTDLTPSTGLQGPIEAAFLWDIRPVGDLIRLRMAHAEAEPVSSLRIALAAGLVVRRESIPGVISTRIEETGTRREWVALLAPPLPRDVPIEVDFWRANPPGSVDRRWPEIEVKTSGKFSSLLGLRRPADWSGQLDLKAPGEPLTEPNFLKVWGAMPDDDLIMANLARVSRSAKVVVSAQPIPLQRSIRTRLLASLAQGRLNATIEATLNAHQGRSFDLDVTLPGDLRVIRVEGDGLLDWQRLARDQLRLQFDGTEVLDRKIKIEASLACPADGLMTETRSYQARLPLLRWSNVESMTGTVEVAGPTRFQVDPGAGLTLVPRTPTTEPDPLFRSTYRVEPASGSSTVTWSAPPANVNVSVDSELAIEPAAMSWTAAMNCEVSGGPAGSINLKLPTEWAENASVEIEGMAHRRVSQTEGPRGEITQWKLLPESPLWGVARLIVRSRRPIRAGQEFAYPQVAPLATTGRGVVGRYDLAILNLANRALEVTATTGLNSLNPGLWRAIESSDPQRSARPIDHAYRVSGERWSLRLKAGRIGDEVATDPAHQPTRVESARFAVAIGSDGATWGRARLDLAARAGPFLEVRLADGSEILWATVEGSIRPASRDSRPGRWLIPLGDSEPRRVTIAWHRPAPDPGGGSVEKLDFPEFDQPIRSRMVAVDAPESADLSILGEPVEALGRVDWEVEMVEQIARSVVERLGRSDREAIIDELSEIELRVRQVRRIKGSIDGTNDPSLDRLQVAINSVVEATEARAFEDLIQVARVRGGVAQASDDLNEGLAGPTPELVRLRRSGLPRILKLRATDPSRPLAVHWNRSRLYQTGGISTRAWIISSLGLAFWLILGGLIARGVYPPSRLAVGLVLVAFLALLAWQPLGFVAALGLAGWGRSLS